MKKKFLLLIILFASHVAMAQVPKLVIVKGKSDTVFVSEYLIRGVTNPKAKVTINNDEVKVYKTGAFEKQFQLNSGINQIKVVSSYKDDIQKESFGVYLSTQKHSDRFKRSKVEPLIDIKDTSYYVKTLPGAYLLYSVSDDRLGGSKLCYIDEDIVFKVVQEYGSLRKVQVSENRYFYIPKFVTVPTTVSPKQVSTSSWSVNNRGEYDLVSINVTNKQPYIVRTELNPSMIIIDIFGAKCNSNWMTQRGEFGAIDFVDFEQVDSDIYRAKIYLKSKTLWGYSIGYEGNQLVLKVKHAPKSTLKGMRIAIDPGHGGAKSSGAVGVSGLKEKDVNLLLAQEMKEILKLKGAEVILTRDSDIELSLSERIGIAKEAKADILISIHNNAASKVTVKGASTYYKHIHSRQLAKSILNRMLEVDGVVDFGLIGNFNFRLNSPTEFISVLIEAQFMSNLEDEERVADPKFRKLLMRKAVKGIEDFL